MNKKAIRAVIDTMELGVNVNTLNANKLLEREAVEDSSLLKAINPKNKDKIGMLDSKVNLIIKVHNIYKTDREQYITSLSEYKQTVKNILKNIDIEEVDQGKVTYDRVDIAIDIDINYYQNFKKLLYFFELITADKKDFYKWFTTNFKKLKNNTIKLHTSSLDISFYDKEFESNGKSEYKTRLEFRFLRLKNNTIEQYLDKLIDLLKDIDHNISYIEEVMTNKLIELYFEELEEDNIPFDEFVRQYKKFIYTNNILKALHKKFCNTKYEYWIKNFRKKYKIDLISFAEINNFKKDCIRSIKQYKRS